MAGINTEHRRTPAAVQGELFATPQQAEPDRLSVAERQHDAAMHERARPSRGEAMAVISRDSRPLRNGMAHIEYREIACKSALNRVQGMPFRWSLNPYRGCVHRCRFCFASPTHRYFDLDDAEDFFGIIFVKTNLPEVLIGELSRRTWRREQVAVGTATDPYQPAEGRYRLTRRCLAAFARHRTPISLVTKGTMVLRDLDVLQDLTQRAGATVCFSVPTVDAEIWRQTELGTPPPWQRLRVMERLVTNGIRAGVLMAPLLPGLSANPKQIERTVRAAADHGACFIGASLLHLDAGIRDYFLGFLEREYPELLDGYRRLYAAKYAPKAYQLRVERRVQEAKAIAGYGETHHRRVEPPSEPQLALPLLAR
jgi:DNA repair photolyase